MTRPVLKKLSPKAARSFLGRLLIFLLMCGLAYVVLFPFFVKLSSSLMSQEDLYDTTVALIPRRFTLDNFRYVMDQPDFTPSVVNTFLYALGVAVCTVISATLVGYGLGRFHFRGVNLCLLLLVITMLVPGLTVMVPLYSKFRFFDIFGIFRATTGAPLNLTGTIVPVAVLALTSLGFRGGIHTLLMRSYFKGVPNEMAEAARVDGANAFQTFLLVMMPMARSMMIVIFLLSFAWQWTDTYFTNIFYGAKKLLPSLVMVFTNANQASNKEYFIGFVRANAGALLALLPPLLIYIIFQRKIMEGIERAGLVG